MMGSSEEGNVEEERLLGELALFGDQAAVVHRLGTLGADPNDAAEHMNGWSPLLLAARSGHVAVVEELCSAGSEVDFPNQGGGWTALHRAAFEGHAQCVRALVAHGAAVNKRTAFNNGALHWCAENGHYSVAAALLELGADATLRDGQDLTPWHWAEQAGHTDVAELIGPPPPPAPPEPEELRTLGQLAQLGLVPGIARRLAQGVDPNNENEFEGGNSPLYWAGRGGHHEVIKLLCEHGAATDWKDPVCGMTALHRAAALGQDEAVRALVEDAGATIDALDESPTPCTPLHDAATRGRERTEGALLDLGADASERAKLGDLAHIGDVTSIKQRLALGADPDDPAEFKAGECPLYWAAFKGHVDVIEVLCASGASPIRSRRLGV